MKQRFFILAGVMLIIILLLIWLYIFVFGKPASVDDIYNNILPGGEEDGGIILPPEPEPDLPSVDGQALPRLRQLTIDPVIGFTEVQATATDPIRVRYAEAGTGHIYEIDLEGKIKNRLLNNTVKEPVKATFSPDGQTVAIRTDSNKRYGNLLVQRIPTSEVFTLPQAGLDFTLFSSSTGAFTKETSSGLVSSSYTLPISSLDKLPIAETDSDVIATSDVLPTVSSSALFTIPFYEATISWGTSTTDSHVVFPKPSYALEGYLYTFTNGKMARLPAQGFGFTAYNTPGFIIYTATTEYKPASWVFNKETRELSELPFILLPEKCALSLSSTLYIYCASQNNLELPLTFPDAWYRGDLAFSDTLSEIHLPSQSARYIVDTLEESGRQIDINQLTAGLSGTALYFTNKTDNTLWMYEL